MRLRPKGATNGAAAGTRRSGRAGGRRQCLSRSPNRQTAVLFRTEPMHTPKTQPGGEAELVHRPAKRGDDAPAMHVRAVHHSDRTEPLGRIHRSPLRPSVAAGGSGGGWI